MANEEQEKSHSRNLKVARQKSSDGTIKSVKDFTNSAKDVTGVLAQASLFKDMPYAIALGAAILKDVLDLAFIGSLPGIGTVLTICASILIFFMMLLSGSGQRKKIAGGMIKKGLALIGGTTFEMIGFGLNFFPIQTATVFLVYWMELVERKKIAEKEAEEAKKAQEQQNNLVAFSAKQASTETGDGDKKMPLAA